MMVGTPNLQIHPENNATATSSAALLAKGSAFLQRLVLSITVKMWLKPLEGVGAHQVDVYVGKPALQDRDWLQLDLKMAMDF
jgi:hypothetical protein